MQPEERNALADAAYGIALKVQANDQPGLQKETIAEFATNFSGIGNAVAAVAPKLSGKIAEVEQIYILDATANTQRPDGSNPDAEFVCTLKTEAKEPSEADFTIPGLPPGRYAFAIVEFSGASPWQLSLLLRKNDADSPWRLAGLFPKEKLAAGHDGSWFWSQGRILAAKKQPWVAYLYYAEARQLLQPAIFVSSTHLENLRNEAADAAPPQIINGVSSDEPLVIKAADGTEYRFTSFAPDNGLRADKLDIALHMNQAQGVNDPAAMQKRNRAAMSAFLASHPELRDYFHGLWVFTDVPNQLPVATFAAMNEIH
ncbi:MAG: hypothetical protein ABI158_00425 [Edaphobacter sp.]